MLLGANYACSNLCCKNALCVKYKRNVSFSCLWEISLSCPRLTVYNSRHFDQGEPKCLQQTPMDFFFLCTSLTWKASLSLLRPDMRARSIKRLVEQRKKLICSDNELISWVEFFCVFRYQRRPGCCPSTLIICCFLVLFSSKLDMFCPLIFDLTELQPHFLSKHQWDQILNFHSDWRWIYI